MRECKRRKRHAKVMVIFFIVFLLAAAVFFLQKGQPEQKEQAESRVPVLSQTSAEEYLLHKGEVERNEETKARQIILSMGKTPDILFISWRGDKAHEEYLRFSRNEEDLPNAEPIEGEKAEMFAGKYCRYTVRLAGLKAGREYFYEIGDGVSFDCRKSFEVMRESGATEFLYLGDVQFENSLKDYDSWGRMIGRIYRENSELDFAVIGGDMVNVPTEKKQWVRFLDNCDIFSRLPLMTISGNHEGVHSNITYKKIFAMPQNGPKGSKESFYYFDYGKCRFIMMDSSFLTEARKKNLGRKLWQRYEKDIEAWLSEALEENKKTWTIAVIHHPPYGMHDRHTVSPEIRRLWMPILEKAEVDMILSGHQHMYMRTGRINGTLYVMGNSGSKTSEYYNGYNAPLYSRAIYSEGPNYQIIRITSSELKLISYNEKGLVIDETSLRKRLPFHIIEFFSGG